ncbi:DUF6748 domain-containing protein [Hyalangium rubrum]|uniref:DUF6748 domain-containing protein n=1 Tax=Hyalangium rubrum TaxID=3103134 RepID=A0ABU5HE93_9BACT|nr:DUF6748 domain-containing protein [Hyalangium sp. s54d21]MDY7230410.1 DUF6748 domain-containing protein [Hyalangium sp. s54d21]
MRKSLVAFLMMGASACGLPGALDSDNPPTTSGQSGKYQLTNSGIQCTQAPCPTILVTALGTDDSVLVSDIAFPDSMPLERRKQLANQLFEPGGLVAEGTPHGEGMEGVFELESVTEP